jgi:hypothetical protein
MQLSDMRANSARALVSLFLLPQLACTTGGASDSPQAGQEPEESAEAEPGTGSGEETEGSAATNGTPSPDPSDGNVPYVMPNEPEPEPEPEPTGFLLPDGQVRPLSDAERSVFWGSADDAIPEVLDAVLAENEGTHFLYSDELHLDLFQPRLADIGGGYIGVGSDQAYLFMGWQRPELAWLADYDPWIAALHRSYLVFFENAPDIETFEAMWSPDSAEESRELLNAAYADRNDLDLIQEVFRVARPRVARRLRAIRRMGDSLVPTFMTDADQYTFIRQMVQAGRVRPMVGNLLAEVGYRAIGDAARELGVPIRHVYISNAEDYWAYPDSMRQNMAALPVDEQSIISRTRATKPRNGDYRYMQQPAQNFVRWLQSGVGRCREMWGYQRVDEDEFPITFFTDEPPVADPAGD